MPEVGDSEHNLVPAAVPPRAGLVPWLEVTGGRAGSYAVFADLEHWERKLQARSESYVRVAAWIARTILELALAQGDRRRSWGAQVLTAATETLAYCEVPDHYRVDQLKADLRGLRRQVEQAAVECQVLGQQLLRVATAYVEAEKLAGQQFINHPYLALLASPKYRDLAQAHARAPGGWSFRPARRVLRALNIVPAVYRALVRRLADVAAFGELIYEEPKYLGIAPEPIDIPEAAEVFPAPSSVVELLGNVGEVTAWGDGSVLLQSLTVPGVASTSIGQRHHILYLPGTQDWSLAGSSQADLAANLELLAGRTTDAAQAALDALVAGKVSATDPLLIVGYSQSGMVALALLQDPRFRAAFNPQIVVTAGAPTATFEVPTGVTALHLENYDDLVPAFAGTTTPDQPNRVTVRFHGRTIPAGAVPVEPTSIAGAHHVSVYQYAAQALSHNGSSAWRDTESLLQDFLRPESVVAANQHVEAASTWQSRRWRPKIRRSRRQVARKVAEMVPSLPPIGIRP